MREFLIGIILVGSIFTLIRFLYIKYKGKKAKAKVLGYYYWNRYRYVVLEFKDDKGEIHRGEKCIGGRNRVTGVEPVKLYKENSYVDIIYREWNNLKNEKEKIILDSGKEFNLTEQVYSFIIMNKWSDSSKDLKANKITTVIIIVTLILLIIWLYIL